MGLGRHRRFFPIIALVPILLGGRLLPDPPGAGTHGSVSVDSAAYWVFLTEEAWEAAPPVWAPAEFPGRIRTSSTWLRAWSVELPREQVAELLDLPGVSSVRPVGRLPVLPVLLERQKTEGPAEEFARPGSAVADSIYGELGSALEIVGIPSAHALGFMGAGTRIGILDGFFSQDHASLQGNPPLAVRDFVDNDGSVEPSLSDPEGAAAHGTALWSLLSGDWPGTFKGAAPEAGILLARIRKAGDLMSADEDRWVAGLEWLETQGARIVLTGVGFRSPATTEYPFEDLNGDVTPATRAADEAARRGVLVVAPVGNDGPGNQTLQAPADGDSVMAVGAVDLQGSPVGFSALGPTADGRPKPEFYAPGEALPAASDEGTEAFQAVQGTEFAGALLAGGAALFVEAYPERGPLGILEAMETSTHSWYAPPGRIPQIGPAILYPDGVRTLPIQEVTPDGQVTDLAPRLQWNVPTTHPLGLPTTFRLELASDSLFQEVVMVDSVVGTFARRLQEPLPPRTSLFWRVEARSVQGVRWATSPQGPVEVPSWVSLDVLNDPGGTQVSEPQPEFGWTAMELTGAAGPLSFELQVLLDREGEVLQAYSGLQEPRHRINEPLPFNVPLRWRVIAEARTGAVDTVTSAGPFVVTGGANPPVTILYQNFPNPFPAPDESTRETRIWFDLATESTVELALYDMRGRLVRRLIPGPGCGSTELPPGLYGREEGPAPDPCVTLVWDGRDDRGGRVAPGVYLLRLKAGGVVEVRRVVYWP